jgi:hypothetical protein
LLSAQICSAAVVEIYPGPGVETYRSSLYAVEILDGSSWVTAYVYGFKRSSVCNWHPGASPSVNFLTFGTSGSVDVRVARTSGSIASADVSPHSRNVPFTLASGRVVLTLSPNDKVWITIDGDDANPLFLFADPPKPPVPPGATYVGPGVLDITTPGHHYKASSNEVIYLDGGAWVRGNVDLRGTSKVRIMGPGILSGDLWIAEQVGPGALPFDQSLDYAMIHGDFFGGDGASVEGVTIVDSPGYNFYGGVTHAAGVKVLSPWFYSTDGFQGVSHVDRSFIFNGDNAFAPMWTGWQNDNVTITRSFAGTTNNSVFAGGYWGYERITGYSAFVDDIDIKTYNDHSILASVFQVFLDNSDPTQGYSDQIYQNIRIEGNVNARLLVLKNLSNNGGAITPLGNGSNFVFRNITLTGTQKYLSQIQGWDASNGFHNVVLENVRINGTMVDQTNVPSYFDINGYVWGLSFGSAAASFFTVPPCRAVDTRGPAGLWGGPSLAAGADRAFTVIARCGVPAGARAIAVNATVVEPTAGGFLTLYPGGAVRPVASTLNYRAGRTLANSAMVGLGPAGEIVVHCGQPSGTAHFVLDVNGYFE